MIQSPVVYIRGLNTFGKSHFRVGPLPGRRMDYAWERALRARDIEYYPILNYGKGTLDELVDRAVAEFEEHRLSEPVHLLGHSLGGLLARAIAHQRGDLVRSVTTMATPHLGAPLSLKVLELLEKEPGLVKLFKALGYDANSRKRIFSSVTPEALERFNERYPNKDLTSVTFKVPKRSLSWPLKRLHGFLGFTHEGDGMVDHEVQIFGRTLGPFELDHFTQVGLQFPLGGQSRRQTRSEFNRLVEALIHHWQRLEI